VQAAQLRPGSRRSFIDRLIGTGIGGIVLSALYPVVQFLIPPATRESAKASVALSLAAEDVASNTGTIFKFGSQPGILVRMPDGELRAFSAVCTHLGCTVQYRSDLRHIWCACHNGHFDLNGVNVGGPPPRPLDRYGVHVLEGRISVSRDL
jgi:Rieske Fe-S protein